MEEINANKDMTVKDLIEMLSKLPQNYYILACDEGGIDCNIRGVFLDDKNQAISIGIC